MAAVGRLGSELVKSLQRNAGLVLWLRELEIDAGWRSAGTRGRGRVVADDGETASLGLADPLPCGLRGVLVDA
jgi:hypothetical protein